MWDGTSSSSLFLFSETCWRSTSSFLTFNFFKSFSSWSFSAWIISLSCFLWEEENVFYEIEVCSCYLNLRLGDSFKQWVTPRLSPTSRMGCSTLNARWVRLLFFLKTKDTITTIVWKQVSHRTCWRLPGHRVGCTGWCWGHTRGPSHPPCSGRTLCSPAGTTQRP